MRRDGGAAGRLHARDSRHQGGGRRHVRCHTRLNVNCGWCGKRKLTVYVTSKLELVSVHPWAPPQITVFPPVPEENSPIVLPKPRSESTCQSQSGRRSEELRVHLWARQQETFRSAFRDIQDKCDKSRFIDLPVTPTHYMNPRCSIATLHHTKSSPNG